MTRNERGMSQSLQWAVLLPVLLVSLLGAIQGGVWLHGRSCARQAAAAGADTASIAGQAAGAAAALDVATRLDLAGTTVEIVSAGDVWDVTVTARAPLFFDIGQGVVVGHAVMAKEGEG